MAITMSMRWEGVSPSDYDTVRNIVKWEQNPAPGGLYHVASFDGKALYVTDIWDSPEDMNAFIEQRLMPGVAQAGFNFPPPVIEVRPVHAIHAPAYHLRAENIKA